VVLKTLVITGSNGAGKTTMIDELSVLLAAAGVAHAAIDIDALGSAHDPRDGIDLAAIAYGMWRERYVGRVAPLEEMLDKAAVEDFAVANDGCRPITEVAREILQRAGW
jgi:predicted ATPase